MSTTIVPVSANVNLFAIHGSGLLYHSTIMQNLRNIPNHVVSQCEEASPIPNRSSNRICGDRRPGSVENQQRKPLPPGSTAPLFKTRSNCTPEKDASRGNRKSVCNTLKCNVWSPKVSALGQLEGVHVTVVPTCVKFPEN